MNGSWMTFAFPLSAFWLYLRTHKRPLQKPATQRFCSEMGDNVGTEKSWLRYQAAPCVCLCIQECLIFSLSLALGHTCGLVHATLLSLNNVFQYLSIYGNAFHRTTQCVESLINDWFLPTQLASFSVTFWFSFGAFFPLLFSPSLPLVHQFTWHDCLLFLPFISLLFTNTVLQTKIPEI